MRAPGCEDIGRAREQELAWARVAVDDAFDLKQQLGSALNLVDDDRVGQASEKPRGVSDRGAQGDLVIEGGSRHPEGIGDGPRESAFCRPGAPPGTPPHGYRPAPQRAHAGDDRQAASQPYRLNYARQWSTRNPHMAEMCRVDGDKASVTPHPSLRPSMERRLGRGG